MRIFKYPLYYYSVPEIVRLPKGAQITTFGFQLNNNPKTVMWALVEENNEIEERIFKLVMTGHSIGGEVKLIYNTIEMPNGIVLTLVEVSGVKGNDPEKDDRIKKQKYGIE